jgi:hypothetical protein
MARLRTRHRWDLRRPATNADRRRSERAAAAARLSEETLIPRSLR